MGAQWNCFQCSLKIKSTQELGVRGWGEGSTALEARLEVGWTTWPSILYQEHCPRCEEWGPPHSCFSHSCPLELIFMRHCQGSLPISQEREATPEKASGSESWGNFEQHEAQTSRSRNWSLSLNQPDIPQRRPRFSAATQGSEAGS